MTSETVQIHGLKELNAKLKRMAARDANRITRRGISKMAQVIRKEMRDRAPRETGDLRKNLAYSIKRDLRGGFRGTVGPKPKAFYARFIEFGTAAHLIPRKDTKGRKQKRIKIGDKVYRSVDHPGIQPRPFLRPAFEASKRRTVDEAGKLMWKLIEEAARK